MQTTLVGIWRLFISLVRKTLLFFLHCYIAGCCSVRSCILTKYTWRIWQWWSHLGWKNLHHTSMRRPLTGTILCEAEDSSECCYELVLLLNFLFCMLFGLEGTDVGYLYESTIPFHSVDIYEEGLIESGCFLIWQCPVNSINYMALYDKWQGNYNQFGWM